MTKLMVYNHKKTVKISKSPKETFEIAKKLTTQIQAPCLIGLTGELGAGKTVFAKGVAASLGVQEEVTSPTFLGISEYFSGKYPFIHMDFFKKVVEEEKVNFYLKNGSVVLIEWFENFNCLFARNLDLDIRIYIQYLKDKSGNILENEREIIVE